jgi:hypothetical protein
MSPPSPTIIASSQAAPPARAVGIGALRVDGSRRRRSWRARPRRPASEVDLRRWLVSRGSSGRAATVTRRKDARRELPLLRLSRGSRPRHAGVSKLKRGNAGRRPRRPP